MSAVLKNPVSRFGFGAILFALIVAEAASAFETAMIFVAIPHLMAEYQVGAATAGWMVTAFYLVAAMSAGICGRLGDLYGRRRLIIILLLISGAGSLVSLVGDNIYMVIAGRAVQGLAGAIMPLAIALAREIAPKGKANTAISAVAATAVVAGSAGGLLSGVLIDTLSWHAIFVASTILAIIAAALMSVIVPVGTRAQRHEGERLDWTGAVLLGVSIATVLYGVTTGGKRGWTDSLVLSCLGGGLALLVVFVIVELRTKYPLIEPRLFLQRHLMLTLLATAGMGGIAGGFGTLVSIVQQAPANMPIGLGMTATAAGLLTGATALAAYSLTPILGRISRAFGGRMTLLIGAVIGLLYVGSFALLFETIQGFIVVSMIGAVAMLFVYASMPILVAESVPEERMGEIAGAQVVLRTAMTSVASAVATSMLATSTVTGTTLPDVTGMNRNLLVIALWTAPLIIIALLLRRKKISETRDAPDEAAGSLPDAQQVVDEVVFAREAVPPMTGDKRSPA